MESKKEEVLRQLKLVRKAKGLSYQNIVDGTESIGTAVSMSTVKRVFAENSKASEFKYSTTLRPIVRFVMGVEEDFYEAPQSLPEAQANVEGLAAVVDFKDSVIERMEDELDHAHKEADRHRKVAKGLWITTLVLAALLVASFVLLEAYIVLDFDHPEWGLFFR